MGTAVIEQEGLTTSVLDKVVDNPSGKHWLFHLHSHLKQDRKLSKCEIGTIYVNIDPQLKAYRAYNAYRVIENMLRTHKKNLDTPMTYYKARVSPTKLPSCNENKIPQTPTTSNPHYL